MADCAAARARSKWLDDCGARWLDDGGEVHPPCEKKERDLSSAWMWLSR
jgi:hypothetical protein